MTSEAPFATNDARSRPAHPTDARSQSKRCRTRPHNSPRFDLARASTRDAVSLANVEQDDVGAEGPTRPAHRWIVERIILPETNEEISVVRDRHSWVPAPLAMRFTLHQRHVVGPARLVKQMRGVALVYDWAASPRSVVRRNFESGGIGVPVRDIETFFRAGSLLLDEHLVSLADYLRDAHGVTDATQRVAASTYNDRAAGARAFLRFAANPTNHGGSSIVSIPDRKHWGEAVDDYLEADEEKESERIEPLSPDEVRLVRLACMPDEFGEFQNTPFAPDTAYRNWAMFETGLAYGPRLSELLTVRTTSLLALPHAERTYPSRPGENRIDIVRQQNAPKGETRLRNQPRGKTRTRFGVPPLNPIAWNWLRRYATSAPPIGRVHPRNGSPYVFVTNEHGPWRPISKSLAYYIIKTLGAKAADIAKGDFLASIDEDLATVGQSLRALRWHQLRHTWAEVNAVRLFRDHGRGGIDTLCEWGGWSPGSTSVYHYTQHARRALASDHALRVAQDRDRAYYPMAEVRR